MKNTLIKLCIPVLSLFLLLSCGEDGEAELDLGAIGFTGSSEDIQDFLTEDVYDALIGLGLDINTGSDPQNIEGTFRVSPRLLENTNIEGDFDLGTLFRDKIMTFSNQDNETLTVNYSAREVDENGNTTSTETGIGSFISGSTNGSFTVILRTIGQSNGLTIETAIAISGTISSTGIIGLQESFILLDDGGDPNDDLIEIGEGRVIGDGDNLAVRE